MKGTDGFVFVRSDGGDGGGEHREDVFRTGWFGQGAPALTRARSSARNVRRDVAV